MMGKVSTAKAKKISVPDGPGWDYARHLANSRVTLTPVTLQGPCGVSVARAAEILAEASGESMGWFNEVAPGIYVGRL